jgi:uncharacterized UPF0146 family protein
MRLTLKERQSLTRVIAGRYKRARKKEKIRILDEFLHSTGYNRKYAAYVLRMQGKRIRVKEGIVIEADVKNRRKRRRPRVYDDEVLKGLRKIWKMMNYICGKRLAPVMEELILKLQQHKELDIDKETRQKLFRISAATMDRLLSKDRKRLKLKNRSRTKPGTLLKHQIPIRTFSEWDDGRPGFIEMDLVGHDGGDASSEYIQSLNCVDVCTGWTETFAVRNKAQIWVFNGIEDMKSRLPFNLLGIDSDNGSEFINAHLLRYCQSEGITFTRSRAYRKNDSCHVEQKNYTAVRQYVGYFRYDTEEELNTMKELYRNLSLYLNYFHPVMKLKTKERIGSKIKKIYDMPRTPYQRVLKSPEVQEQYKEKIKQVYARLNPAELHRKVVKLQNKLLKITLTKKEKRKLSIKKRSSIKTQAETCNYQFV